MTKQKTYDDNGEMDEEVRVKSRWRRREEGGWPSAKHVASITDGERERLTHTHTHARA